MTVTQADLFAPDAPALPREKTWYAIRFTGRETIVSPTQGQMWRIRGVVTEGPFAGLVVWKPLTHSLPGIGWCERQLRACGWKAYHFARLRERWGVGHYLEGLMDAVTGLAAIEATIYAYDHPTEGRFWTLRSLRKAA